MFATDERVGGRTHAEWIQSYLQWVAGAPKERSPLTDPSGEFATDGQPDDAWLLAGNLGGVTRRKLTVPAGRPIFSPVLYAMDSAPAQSPNLKPMTGRLPEMDMVESMTVTLDGESLGDLTESRVQSGQFRLHGVPRGQGVMRAMEGERLAAADGYWFMLKPLSPGQHTLRVRGNLKGQNGARGFALDITYELMVIER
jgi:hypothetical protein